MKHKFLTKEEQYELRESPDDSELIDRLNADIKELRALLKETQYHGYVCSGCGENKTKPCKEHCRIANALKETK